MFITAIIKPKICNLRHYLNKSIIICNYSKTVNLPRNIMEDYISAHRQKENGMVYDKKPFKMRLEANKKYVWCLCGYSHTQPFCDGTHRNQQLRITQKPIHFMVDETKDYWLCNCKHTENRPFCDGTHKSQSIQDANAIVKH